MSPEEESTSRVAQKLGMSPVQVEQILVSLAGSIDSTVLRHKMADQVEMFLNERLQKFRTIKPEELTYNQGMVAALDLAIKSVITPQISQL